MFKMKNYSFIEQTIPHESGAKHVSGYANYIDDILIVLDDILIMIVLDEILIMI